MDGPMGSIRINSSQIDSKVEYANVDLMMTTSVQEVLKESLKQFEVQVRRNWTKFSIVECGNLEKCVLLMHTCTLRFPKLVKNTILVILVGKCLTDSHRRRRLYT